MSLTFVDFDGTLLDGCSSEKLFFRWLLRRRMMGSRQVLAFSLFPLRWGVCYGWDVWKKNKAYLCGLSVGAVEKAAALFVDECLVARLYQPMVKRLCEHAAAGDVTVLLTGTLDCIAKVVAPRLHIERVCATACHTEDGRFTARPPRRHPYGVTKCLLAEHLCGEMGDRLGDCVAYGDSSSDIPLLEAVSRAVAVQPKPGLRRVAEARGWEVL
ncbi:MAG: HAD family phosphatase [Candidatus Pacebacteria bacterium]|nr:HAD family phosphatase [Candidatus Paceibacterota bacterium]